MLNVGSRVESQADIGPDLTESVGWWEGPRGSRVVRALVGKA